MKKRLIRRLFAVCLGLIIVLSACASVDAPSDSSSADEISKETSTLEQSQLHAESDMSEAESSAVSEESEHSDETVSTTPIEPTYPEERETTLELVGEYLVGEGGIPYLLQYESDPTYAGIEMPYEYCLDEKGNLYACFLGSLCNIQSSEYIKIDTRDASMVYMYVYGDKLYYTATDGTLNVVSLENGLKSTAKIVDGDGTLILNLYPTDDGAPVMYQDEKMYDANGSKVSSDYTIHSSQGAMTINGIRYEIGDQPFQRVLSNVNDVLVVRTYNYASYPSSTAVDEYIYYQIGADGNLISEFAIYQQWTPEKYPCSLTQGDAVCKWYTGYTVQIAKQCFFGVLSAYNFVGADNQIYALIIYPDRAELYKINPGYSDVTPIDFDKMEDPAESPETWEDVNVMT